MPLTVPAHQLVVLPFLGRRALPGSALVVGTILPDLAFPAGGFALNVWSHTWLAPPVMALVGLALYVWAELLLLPALARVLPGEGRWPFARLYRARGLPRNLPGWLVAYACVTAGAYSHLLLDGFTHAWMWPASVLYPDSGLARLFQQVGSVLFSSAVFAWMIWRMRRLPADAAVPATGLLQLLFATLAGALLGALLAVLVLGWPGERRAWIVLVFSPLLWGAFAGASVGAYLVTRRPTRR